MIKDILNPHDITPLLTPFAVIQSLLFKQIYLALFMNETAFGMCVRVCVCGGVLALKKGAKM